MSNRNAESELKNGMDSGEIGPKVKLHVAFNSGGKCYFPGCSKHLTLQGTNIGECAHIIPRKVGFVREDWKTPLAQRKLAGNLIYVCADHHAVIDNPDNEIKYSADILRQWKSEHENWALSLSKNSPNVPNEMKERLEETLSQITSNLANEIAVSERIIRQLCQECRTLIGRRYLEKAEALLGQIEVLSSDIDNHYLTSECRVLRANLLWRFGDIPLAKRTFLDAISDYEHLDGMFDYIDLCFMTPEPGDLAEKYEERALEIAPQHPRLKLIDLDRKRQAHESLDIEIVEEKWSEDDLINGRFYLTYALFLDNAGDVERRDYFLTRWAELSPDSPRPALFRVLCMTVDAIRTGMTTGDEARTLLNIINNEERSISNKYPDPLNSHDRLSLLVNKLRILTCVSHFSTGEPEQFGELRDAIVSVVRTIYYDKHVDLLLPDVLSSVILEHEQWHSLVSRIEASNVQPSADVLDLLFLQGLKRSIVSSDIRTLVNQNGRSDLSDLLDALGSADIERVVASLNLKEDKFKAIFLQSIEDSSLRLRITENISFVDMSAINSQYFQMEAYERAGESEKALEVARLINLEEVTPSVLSLINHIAYKNSDDLLAIASSEKLLTFDIPDDYRAELHGKLSTAYMRSDDDRKAFIHAEEALKGAELLGNENTRTLIGIAVKSLLARDKNNDAADFVESHKDKIENSPELGIFYADTVLKSNLNCKADRALDYVAAALTKSSDEKIYLSAFLVLNELCTLGAIRSESLERVESAYFVKVSGLDDTWFYLGQHEESFGATRLSVKDDRYLALIDKSLNDEIDWPADKYSASRTIKHVAFICDRNTYIYVKAHEVMQTLAKRGDDAIWSVEVLHEDGSLNQDNLIQFYKDKFGDRHELFKKYCETSLPFGFLCFVEGSIVQALSRISTENEGFVRCNYGTPQHQHEQYSVAEEIVSKGRPFFIDGLTALMLSEADLLHGVIDKLPQLHVSTSVIRTLRDVAEAFRPSTSKGRMGYAGGKLRLSERNEAMELRARSKLLKSADLLDDHVNKRIGKAHRSDGDVDFAELDEALPACFLDAVKLAGDMSALVVTDDAFALQVCGLKWADIPRGASSLALIRCLVDYKHMSWDDYLRYFQILASYRYHHLSISVNDLERTALGVSPGGLILFTPRNLDYLCLSFTFSNEYGVDDKTAIHVTILFFLKIISRDDVTEQMADDIFARTLVRVLDKRDAKMWGQVICAVCARRLEKTFMPSALSYKKLELLEKQVAKYPDGFNPILQSVPSLLKINEYE